MTRQQAEKIAEIIDSILGAMDVPARTRVELMPYIATELQEAFPEGDERT